jgi:hypothetical protein
MRGKQDSRSRAVNADAAAVLDVQPAVEDRERTRIRGEGSRASGNRDS